MLRALASVGIFHEDEERRFSLTQMGELLKSDAPGSKRSLARMAGAEFYVITSYSIHYTKLYDSMGHLPSLGPVSTVPDMPSMGPAGSLYPIAGSMYSHGGSPARSRLPGSGGFLPDDRAGDSYNFV